MWVMVQAAAGSQPAATRDNKGDSPHGDTGPVGWPVFVDNWTWPTVQLNQPAGRMLGPALKSLPARLVRIRRSPPARNTLNKAVEGAAQ